MEAQVRQSRSYLIDGVMCASVLAFAIYLVVAPAVQTRRRFRGNPPTINNLKNLALAVHNYAFANGGTLPSSHFKHQPPMSWRTQMLQYLDRADLQRSYNPELAFDAGVNKRVANYWLQVFDSPEVDYKSRNSSGMWRSDYGMVSGPGTVQPDDVPVTLDEISEGDGLGQTLIIVECSGLQLGWSEPRDPRVDRETIGIEHLTRPGQTSKSLISTYNSYGAPVAFADGAARSLSSNIDPKVLAALCTVNGGEPITQDDYIR